MTKATRNTILRVLALAGFLLLAYVTYYAWQVVVIGAAYKAKVLCSGVFVSNRNPQDILREDLEGALDLIKANVDTGTKSVTTTFPGVPSQRAVFRERLGCTLLAGDSDPEGWEATDDSSAYASRDTAKGSAAKESGSFGDEAPDEPPPIQLAKVVDAAFSEANPGRPVRTRAVLVVHDGQIIAERYAAGISAETPLAGWSMTKSVVNALIGILVYQGKLSTDSPVPIAEWSGIGDRRREITLDQMLRMSSGLEFDERDGPVVSDVNWMLLRSPDAAGYALSKPLQHEPGSYWHYSSGTTNILSRVMRDTVGGSVADYHAFPHKALFDNIGMSSAVMEVDASGTFVGSSFMYATARDWARFGLLYLRDGIWEGERILPPGWVRYSSTPSPTAPEGRYGAHFWTNGAAGSGVLTPRFKKLPADAYFAVGFEGQFIVIVPSRKVVVVRLGQTRDMRGWDMEKFVADVLEAIPSDEHSGGPDNAVSADVRVE